MKGTLEPRIMTRSTEDAGKTEHHCLLLMAANLFAFIVFLAFAAGTNHGTDSDARTYIVAPGTAHGSVFTYRVR
jgi:hypothetical protein